MKPQMFKKAENKLTIMQNLQKLRQDLINLGEIPADIAVYDYGVRFFNIIAKFQDANMLDTKTINMFKSPEMKTITTHIERAGRDIYGWVRSERGEDVTLDNLYLGNVAGIWTFAARKFKEMPNDKYVQDNIQYQLSSFIKSHRQPMIELLAAIQNKEQAPNRFLTMFAQNSKVK